MTIEEAVRARVETLAPVIAIVGDRVFTDTLPQGVQFPAVLVQLVDDPQLYHLRGPDGLKKARVQVDAYAHEDSSEDPYGQAVALAAAIDGDGLGTNASGLSGWKGHVGSPPVVVRSCFRTNRLRRYDPDELRLLTMTQDYIVSYTTAGL